MTSDVSSAAARPDRSPQRVRHELRRRVLDVIAVERVTPHLVRVTLGGEALEGFTSPGFDDHVKLMFPDPATGRFDENTKPAMRDYTPCRYDAAAKRLQIDFALHDAGPATQWAEQAKPGQQLGVGGPKGSFIVTTDFDWHLLIGDDTALPAISRRLAELPKGARAIVLAEVDSAADQIAFDSAADVSLHWVHRKASNGAPRDLLAALADVTFIDGDYYAWVACESNAAKALRAALIARGANPKWTKAAGYWRRGSVASHDKFDD